jgi:hypothetical protein
MGVPPLKFHPNINPPLEMSRAGVEPTPRVLQTQALPLSYRDST